LLALVTTPGQAATTQVAEVADPRAHERQVLVRTLEVGVCGTDREIAEGLFGVPPPGAERLILGHELLGVVERDGNGFARGDLVTAVVRRSCGHCMPCASGAPDACATGDYFERGITRLDGFACELFAEDPAALVGVPRSLGRLGVLAEPASICARALRHAHAIGARQPWEPTRALVVGAGAIGTLATLLLRLEDHDVWTADRRPAGTAQAALFETIGARYVHTAQTPLADLATELGGFDLIVQAAGDAQRSLDVIGLLRRGGVACLLGIDGHAHRVAVDGPVIGVDMVLQNRAVFGSVNANRLDWLAAIATLDAAHKRWPQALEDCVGLRVPLERYEEAFSFAGVKATLQLAGG
jgi:threonine dehydrogenase-like Zn-dependent dehydrogenase